MSGNIEGFEILGHLGTGGCGEVFRARDEETGKEVAFKVLRSLKHMEEEFGLHSKLDLPCVAQLTHYETTVIEGTERAYGVMELADSDLFSLIHKYGRFPEKVARHFFL